MTARLAWKWGLAVAVALAGCDSTWQTPLAGGRADVAPATQPASRPAAEDVRLDSSPIQPMHHDLLAIDLPTVVRVVQARNLDILSARRQVEASHGRYAGSIGSAVPVLVGGVDFDFHRGFARDSQGNVLKANFVSLQPAGAIQWLVNPAQVAYEIVASHKRLQAAQQDELAVTIRTLQQAANSYYELCLAQAAVSAALEAQRQAEELLRTAASKVKAGRAVPADELRARAALAGRQQDMLLAVNAFYHASVALATTLRLDSAVTLVPRGDRLSRVALVRDDLPFEALMTLAIDNRPDLKGARNRHAAAQADRGAVAWGGLGPGAVAGYGGGGLTTKANGQSFDMRADQAATAAAGWKLSAATIGDLQAADARAELAGLDVELQLDQLRADVVRAVEDGRTFGRLIPIAAEQVAAAQESLRQIAADFRVGRAILLDVLDAESSLAQARLRLAQSVARYNQSQVTTLAALGLLTPAALAPAAGASSEPSPARKSE